MLFGPERQFGRMIQPFHWHALPQLRQVAALQAALDHQCVDRIKVVFAKQVRAVTNRMGNCARYPASRDFVADPAQVFKQHHAQRGWQGPKFAQAQFAVLLVGVEKRGENFLVQDAVGVSHIGPGDAINARQTFQRCARELGQARVVAARHAFADLLQLLFDQVKIIQ